MTREEAKKFGLQLLQGIMERNESYPVYVNNIKQAIEALSEPNGSSEIQKDLEEAAIQAAQFDMQDRQIMEASNDERMRYSRIFRRGFKAGAKWQKEQIMKDAVEGRVFMSFAPGHNQMIMTDVDLPTNTKVRVIVLPKED